MTSERERPLLRCLRACVRHAHAKVAHTRRPQTTRERERRGEEDGRAKNDVHFVKAPEKVETACVRVCVCARLQSDVVLSFL